jgi:ABC-type Fe3+-hydroxamate transport system substrate-binding protein
MKAHTRPLHITDQTGQHIVFESTPLKIISCVPSITEYLIEIGLKHAMVGRTKFCIFPKEAVKRIPTIGGTKKLNIAKIKTLAPDLIITNKEENTKTDVEQLQRLCNVYVSDIKNPKEAFDMMASLAQIMEKTNEFEQMKLEYEKKLVKLCPLKNKHKCVYLIWQYPYMTIGGDTFINSMLELAGFTNIFENHKRYPVIENLEESLRDASHLLLSTEPYPFSENHVLQFKKNFPQIKVMLIDGSYMSWYGSRMIKAIDYLHNLNL